MSIPEFLEQLRQTEGPWTLENGHIRCGENCPITQVGGGHHAEQFQDIGDDLGLSVDDIFAIADAADQLDHPLRPQILAATIGRQS